MRKLPWKRLLILVGLIAQLVVPVWMLTKRHLILTRGERVTLRVTLYDPRDLFMGHYVNLSADTIPQQLRNIPPNYLRYYCDQRYARALEQHLSDRDLPAELDVRVWRGAALAEALRIEGVPAYDYVRSHTDTPRTPNLAVWEAEAPFLWERLGDPKPGPLKEILPSRLHHGTTHLLVPIPAPILLNALAHPLGLTLPDTLRPVTPKETDSLCRKLCNLQDLLPPSVTLGLPIFTGLPDGIPCDRSFAEQASAYYSLFRNSRLDARALTFIGTPSPDRLTETRAALREALPKATLLIPSADVSTRRLRLFDLPDATDLTAAQAIVLLESPATDLETWARPIIAALVSEARTRYANTRNPALPDLIDALLLRSPDHTLYRWYAACDSYDSYRLFVEGLRKAEARGIPVFLGGWNVVRAHTGDPPQPPVPILPTSADLLGIARQILPEAP